MADSNFAALAQIGQLDNVAVPSATERKAQQVEMSGLMKQALFGNPQEQAAIATNVLLDTRLSQQQEIIDMRTMEPLAFAAKYGVEAEASRYRYAQAERGLREQKNQERTAAQTAGDMAVGVGQGLTNIVGGTATAVAGAIDGYDALRHEIFGSEDKTKLAPFVSAATGAMSDALQGMKSDNAQTAEAQQGFEASILQEENRQQMLEEQAQISPDAGFFERSFVPGARRVGRDFADVGENILETPQALTNIAGQAVGTLLPMGIAARTIGTTRAMTSLRAQGLTDDAAAAYLKTAAGRKLVQDGAEAAVPTISMLAEGGAGINQAQQSILGMSEADLRESTDYVELRDGGMSHEEAQLNLASDAGTMAGLMAMPGAFLAGKLSASFVANPLGSGGSVKQAVGNVLSEVVEETLQEGNTTVASNLGQNFGAGLDIDVSEGLGGAAVAGALGGAMSAGPMQAPAVAGATLGAAVDGIGAGAEAVGERRERRADATSEVGSVAQAAAATEIATVGADVVANLPETNQTTPSPTGVSARDQVGQALFLSPDEEAAFVGMFPNLAAEKEANPDRPLTRAALANTFGSIVSNKNASEQERQGAAFAFFETLNEMRAVDGDAVIAEVDSVESIQTKESFAALQSQLQTIESNPVIEKAQEALNTLTPVNVGTVIDMDLLNNKDADPAERSAEAARVELLSRVAPEAVNAELINLALNQVGGGAQAESLKKKLSLARQVVDTFKAADESKAAILAEQKAARDALPADQKKKFGKTYETFDLVREQVNNTGNKDNALPSLMEHRKLVSNAANSGHIGRAQDLLGNLSDFAESQVNKLNALAESKNSGLGAKNKVGYRASNGNGFFDQKGVWVDESNPLSIAQAREVEVDANSAVALAEAMAEAYGLDLPKKLAPAKLGLTGNPTTPTQTAAQDTATTQEAQPAVEEAVDVIDDEDTAAAKESFLDPELISEVNDLATVMDLMGIPVNEGVTVVPSTAELREAYTNLLTMFNEIKADPKTFAGFKGKIDEMFSWVKSDIVGENAERADRAKKSAKKGDFSANASFVLQLAEETLEVIEANDKSVSPEGIEIAKRRLKVLRFGADTVIKQDGPYKGLTNQEALILAEGGTLDSTPSNTQETVTPEGDSTPNVSGTDQAPPVTSTQRDELDDQDTTTEAEATAEESDPELIDNEELTEDPTAPVEGSWFDNLKDRLLAFAEDGRNVLLSAFRPREGKSALPEFNGSMEAFVEAMRTGQLSVEALGRNLSATEAAALENVATRGNAGFASEMNAAMNAYIKKKGWADKIRSGATQKILGYRNALPMNTIVAETEAGFEMDPTVLQAAYMATMDWIAAEGRRGMTRMDDEQVSKLFGMGRNGNVSKEMKTFVQSTIPLQMAIESIAKGMEDLLGLEADATSPLKETQGLFRSFAANSLQVMLDNNELTKTEIEYYTSKEDPDAVIDDGKATRKTMIGLTLSDGLKTDPAFKALSRLGSPFASVLTTGRNDLMYVGVAPKQVNPNQIRNNLAPISQKAARVVNKLQNTPAYMVSGMVELTDALGGDEFKRILGYREVTPDMEAVTNAEDLASIKGKNMSMDQGLAGAVDYLNAADEHAQETGGTYTDVPIFFGWRVSSVNRLQQQGSATPQGDKIMRELVSSTRSTLDLSNEAHVDALWLAIAQALDISVEKDNHANVIAEAQELVSGDGALAEAAAIVENWMRDGNLRPGELEAAIKKSGIEPTVKMLHALVTLAEFNTTQGNEFTTSLALEADGKTDGPINAMVNMGTGQFTPADVMRFAKGGLFFTNQQMSLSEYIDREYTKNGEQSTRAEDLYHLAAADLADTMASDPSRMQVYAGVYRVMDAFLPDFALSNVDGDMSMEIGRNLVKNPLTVFLYGSGVKGISDKLTNAMFKEIYKVASEIAAGKANGEFPQGWMSHPLFQKNPDLMEDLAMLLGANDVREMQTAFASPTTLSFNNKTFQEASQQMRKSFAAPMLESVNRATGGLVTNMQLLQRAATVQTLIFQDAVNAAADELLNGENGTEASEIDLQESLISMMGLAPIYDTDDASYQISRGEAERTKKTVAATFAEQLSSRLTTLRASDASVKVSPYMTIGMGDGQMMLNIYDENTGELTASLPVFDGVEMALDKIGEQAPKINKAVWDAWQQANMFQGVLEGFDNMLARIDESTLKTLSTETLTEMDKAFGLKENETLSFEMINSLRAELEMKSMQQTARKRAMARMASQTDHMAAAQSPHGVEGTSVAGGDPLAFDAISNQLNEFYNEELDKLMTAQLEAVEVTEYLDEADPEFQDALMFISEKAADKYPGVRMVSGRRVAVTLSKMGSRLSVAKRKVLGDVLKDAPTVEGTQYYFGTEAELKAFRAEFFPHLGSQEMQAGISYLGEGVAFVVNQTPETFLHEMLHAGMAANVTAYYADPENAPESVRIGVQNLERLMAEVRGLNPETQSLGVLQGVLNDLDGKPASQVLEFSAYVLANQQLSDFSKKTNSYQRMSRVVKQGLAALKRILGIKTSDLPTKDIFDQVRFNTKVVIMDGASSVDDVSSLALNQARAPRNEAEKRARTTHERYQRRAQQFLKARANALKKEASDESTAQLEETKRDAVKLGQAAKKASERAVNAGFRMNKEQMRAFRSVFAVMDSAIEFRPALMRQLHSLHDAVLEKLTAQDLFDAGALDMETAETQLAYIQNGRDRNVLTTFMALAESSEQFRKVLEDMDVTASESFEFNSFDTALESAGAYAMSALARMSFKNIGRKGSAGRTLDKLSRSLSELDTESRAEHADGLISSRIDQANDYLSGKMDQAGQAVDQFARRRRATASNTVTKLGFDTLGFIGSMASRDASEVRGESLTMFMNHINGWGSVRSALHDLRGGTSQNLDILRLINPVKAMVDALRQDFREKTPETLAKQFSEKLNPQVWSAMHKAFGVTDLMAVGLAEAKGLVGNPDTLGQRIRDAEEEIQSAAPQLASRYSDKARALARWRVTGEVTSKNLLRNSKAIANLFNENNRPDPSMVTADIEAKIERLVALYAYDMIGSDTRDMLSELMRKEPEGLGAVLGLTASIRALEKDKKLSADPEKRGLAENNAVQGYIPSLGQAESKVMVAEDKDQYELEMRGWTRIGDYNGSREEDNRVRRGYYQSSTAGKATFKQGIAQTVHSTYSGVSTLTGRLSDDTAGALTGVRAKRIGERLSRAPVGSLDNLEPGEYMLPVFDHQGTVIGFDLSMKPEMTRGLQKDTHMGRMLGVWAGRLLEEEAAHEFNETLVDGIVKHYREGKDKGRADEYVNMASLTLEDPIYKDAWDTLGSGIKEYAEEQFGTANFFPVRKDLIEDAMGYRAASVTDVWTGQTRLAEPAQKVVKDLTTLIMGKKAYPWLKKGEMFVQDAVGVAKTTIIVRSAVVGVANIISNVLHLTLRGVPMTTIGVSGREKILEIQEYVRNKEKIGELQIEYAANVQDKGRTAKIEARISALEAANKRMSISPLIEAGEFSTISEDLTEADVAIREGRIMDYMEKAVDKLPETAGTVARNLLITKDTALFKGLNRMVQYGDFVAKAVLYDHLMSQGRDQREVLDIIMEEFVQYNRLPGRGRDYLESMGTVWFMNYALRIMKVMGNAMRERPLSSLVLMGQVGPAAGVDSVASGSLAGKYADGSLGFSIGPEMGMNAWTLNPWFNIVR